MRYREERLRGGSLAGGRRYRSGGGGGRAVDHVFQFLAGLEIRDLLGGHFHARAGLRVAADTRLGLAGAETAESADLDLVTAAQKANDAVENGLHDDLRFLPGHLHYSGDFFNQIGLSHRILLGESIPYEIAVSLD